MNGNIIVKETISTANTEAADADANNTNVKVMFKTFAPFGKLKTETMPKILIL